MWFNLATFCFPALSSPRHHLLRVVATDSQVRYRDVLAHVGRLHGPVWQCGPCAPGSGASGLMAGSRDPLPCGLTWGSSVFPTLSSPPLATGALDRRLALRLEALTPLGSLGLSWSGWPLPVFGPCGPLNVQKWCRGIITTLGKTLQPKHNETNPPYFAATGFTDLARSGSTSMGVLWLPRGGFKLLRGALSLRSLSPCKRRVRNRGSPVCRCHWGLALASVTLVPQLRECLDSRTLIWVCLGMSC